MRNKLSGSLCIVTMLTAVTPLCGFMFDCGCSWPWLGLDADCNFYKALAVHKCPWCASKAAGTVSVGLSLLAGLLTAMSSFSRERYSLFQEILLRILIGMAVFLALGMVTAEISSLWQDYPLRTFL